MDAQTKFTHALLKRFNAKKLASKSLLEPKRSGKFLSSNALKKYQNDQFLVYNRNVVTFASNNNNVNKHIIFLHGGGYTTEATTQYWWMIKQVLKKSDFKLSFIDYPLAPEHTYKEAHEMLAQAYTELIKKHPKDCFYFLGDSAGGGLGLSFAQTLRNNNFEKMPAKIALLSPWVDISLSNPEIKELEKKDLLLSPEALLTCALQFANGLDLKAPVLSPLYGVMDNLNSIGIFVGYDEIFVSDCRKLKRKIEASDTDLFYKEYPDMQHDFIVLPIKERQVLLKDVLDYLLEK